MSGTVTLTKAAWEQAGTERYGADKLTWRFRCPCCKTAIAVSEYADAKTAEGVVAFSCIGRYLLAEPRDAFAEEGKGPCNYAGGGFFRLNPIHVSDEDGKLHQLFDFADRPLVVAAEAA
ncbi:VVA0879 family protein [Methylobacterium sp. WL120]|uniref:VVA0879 family protein n=1 Tax=Methylobacterium sp. WL120 TaxID=2603887 RepID=UPI0011CAB0E9|nr:VVA0879 family protein [Methylobacterium sp. WL120]TXM65846.1 hypothetical protein FV229_14325 [Methylobacterium sp. WL120]